MADIQLAGRGEARREAPSVPDLRSLPQPEPSAGTEAYRRERELALAHDPRRRANYERYMRSTRRTAEVDYLPIKLDIENVSRCNFRCTMCQVSEWPKGKRAADMPLAQFKRLIDEQYGLVEIKLQGMGEPLMQGDDYFAMIRYARASHIWVRTTTNASLLHLRSNYKKLIDSDPNEVQISIDGASKEVFETIRRGSVYDRVVSNCKLINAYCREKGVRRTKMWVVVQQANRHQLAEFVERAHDMGFQDLTFSLSLTDWGQEEWHRRVGEIAADDAFTPNLAERLMVRGRELGIAVSFWQVSDKYSTESPDKLCPWPFERAYVSSDLRVVPCCMIANPDASELGAGTEMSATWTSQTYAEFRQAHLDGRIPKVCQGCYRHQ